MQQLPVYIPAVFIATTLVALILFLLAIRKAGGARSRRIANWVSVVLVAWLALTGLLAWQGFYADTAALPPRMIFALAPPLLTMILLFAIPGGRRYLDTLPLARLTALNGVRIGVELVLYWLFLHKGVPEVMTFAGRNFDILVGATAPFVAYFGFVRKGMGRRALLIWNIVSLGILLNVVVHGVLSIPTPFQQLAFDQPNIALLYFPYIWLPGFIVPVALFTHLVAIRRLLLAGRESLRQPDVLPAVSALK